MNRNVDSASTLTLDFARSCDNSSVPWGPAGLRSLTHEGVGAMLCGDVKGLRV